MGWLKDFMTAAEPPISSFGTLARRVLEEDDWPAESRMQPRSLAAIFSKLDRDQELDWLADRESVQRVLARQLGRPPGDLRAAVAPAQSASAAGRFFRFADLPYATALDLLGESLPPGIPEVLTTPGHWQHLIWRTPPGVASSLVGRWLEARGRARFVRMQDIDSDTGPVSSVDAAMPIFIHGEDVNLPRLLTRFSTACVATSRADVPTGWQAVDSPTGAQFLPALVDWVAKRLPNDGHFTPDRALAFLQEVHTSTNLIVSFDMALGLCGLLDELSTRQLSQSSLDDLAERFFSRRVAESNAEGSAAAAWLRRNGLDVLTSLFRRALSDSDAPATSARTFDEWLKLVPEEHQHGADIEWMRLSLARSDSSIRPSDIKRAARVVPPGAYRVVRALEHARLLTRMDEADDRLWFKPNWLCAVLTRRALMSLLDGSPFEWGEALLRPIHATDVFAALFDRLAQERTEVLDNLLEPEAEDSPSHAAAVEAAFRAAGLAQLHGAELSQEHNEALWEEQLRLTVELEPDALPMPRVFAAGATQETEIPHVFTTPPELTPGAFYLAAWAISEQLPRTEAKRHALLRPWLLKELGPVHGRLYDSVLATVLAPPMQQVPWRDGAFDLVDRLRGQVGSPWDTPHLLELPGVLADEVAHGVLTFENLSEIASHPTLVEALRALSHKRGIGLAQLARQLWICWVSSGSPSHAFFAPGAPHAAWLWGGLPVEAIEPVLSTWPLDTLPYDKLDSDTWRAMSESLDRFPDLLSAAEAWQIAPKPVALQALERIPDGAKPQIFFGVLWQRFPDELLRWTVSAVWSSQIPAASAALAAAPPEHTRSISNELLQTGKLIELPGGILHVLRRWLHDRVNRRAPDWRTAYTLLAEIERALEPLKG